MMTFRRCDDKVIIVRQGNSVWTALFDDSCHGYDPRTFLRETKLADVIARLEILHPGYTVRLG